MNKIQLLAHIVTILLCFLSPISMGQTDLLAGQSTALCPVSQSETAEEGVETTPETAGEEEDEEPDCD